MAFGTKKKKKVESINEAELLDELCEIVDCDMDELKQVVSDLCAFETDGGNFIDGIAELLGCDEDDIYDEVKRLKSIADGTEEPTEESSQGTDEEEPTSPAVDEEKEVARQLIDALLRLFDCTEDTLLDRVQSTQQIANQYYLVVSKLCDMLGCTVDTVADVVETLASNTVKGTESAPVETNTEELEQLRASVAELQASLEEEKKNTDRYRTALNSQKGSTEEIGSLKKELSERKDENQKLLSQIKQAKDFLVKVKNTNETLKKENTTLKEDVVNLKQKAFALEGERDTLEAERDEFKSKLDVKESNSVEGLTKENLELQEKVASQTVVADNLKKENSDLKAKVASQAQLLEGTQKDMFNLQTQVSDLEGINKDLTEKLKAMPKLEHLQESNCQLKQANESLKKNVVKARKEKDALSTDLAEKDSEVQDYKAQLESSRAELNSVRKEADTLASEKASLEDRLTASTDELKDVKGKLAEVTSTLEGYEGKLSRVTELETELAIEREKENQYTKMIEEITAAVDIKQEQDGRSIVERLCKKFNCEKDALEEVISIAVGDKMPEEESFRGLSIELVTLRSKIRVLEKKNELEAQTIKSLRKIFDDCEVEQLFDIVMSAKDAADRVQSVDEEVNVLQGKVTTLESQLKDSQGIAEKAEEENEALKQQVTTLNADKEKLITENRHYKSEHAGLSASLETVKEDRKALRSKNVSLESDVAELKESLKTSESEVDSLRKERTSLKVALEDAKADLASAKTESKRATDRCTEMRKNLAEVTEKLNTMQDDSEAAVRYKQQAEELRVTLEEEQAKCAELNRTVEELTDGKNKLMERIRQKDNTIESLKRDSKAQEVSTKRLKARNEKLAQSLEESKRGTDVKASVKDSEE